MSKQTHYESIASDENLIVLWYIVVTFILFLIICSKAFDRYVLWKKQRELEERLDKFEKEQQLINNCLDYRLDCIKRGNT
jgi:hypothetical protein